tara:strand:+ start:300 stop:1322 length:1023 start_codon:yes stop_codon:yes gene_type:complete
MRTTLSQSKPYYGGRPKSGWSLRVLFTLAMLCSVATNADPIDVFFLLSKPTTDYLDVLSTVQRELEEKFPDKYSYTLEFVSQPSGAYPIASADLIVTIGTAAAERAYEYKILQSKAPKPKPEAPIISVLITDSSFAALARQYFGSVEQAFARQVSSICIDQPTSRSIQLAKLLLPKAKKAGLMLGPSSTDKQQELARVTSDESMTAEFVTISAKDNPINKIEPVMRGNDVFIPVPDSRLINLATAKWILHLSYRHKVPVIAFSRTYVRAGALAAIYSSPQNVAEQAVEWITDAELVGGGVGQAHGPKYYSMHFNYSVAASLNVVVEKEQFYRDQMQVGNR